MESLPLVEIKFKVTREFLRKSCSENMQQIYRRTAMPKSDFNNAT